MNETAETIDADVEEGSFTRGAQVAVSVGGERRFDLAVGEAGLGTAMTADTVFRIYCTIKPITAVAVAKQVDAGRLDLDEPLVDHVPDVAAVADGQVTLRHVLTHTAGLQRPKALELELVTPGKRLAALDHTVRPPSWQVGARAAYSEVFGWYVLGRLLENVTGEPLREHLRRAVLDPLAMSDTWIGMTDDQYERLLPRLGVSFDMRTLQAFPLLLERGRRMCTEVNPAHGGYSTASDLARFYRAVLAQLAGAQDGALPSADTLRTFVTPARPTMFDEVLDRECDYGLGFMTNLAGHAFGSHCSESSFGHSGNVGSSFAFADPERDLAVAVVYNGIVDPESAFVRRPAIVRAIYADLDAMDDPPAHATEAATPAGRAGRWWRR